MYNISVIGAGVSGLTTALLFQLSGYQCRILTEARMDEADLSEFPRFSSLIPAASIIPHSIFGDQVLALFKDSDQIFKALSLNPESGVINHQHYEIFQEHRAPYDYVLLMEHPELLHEFRKEGYPGIAGINTESGWRFVCRFADWTHYPSYLKKLFLNAGGEIRQQKLRAEDIEKLHSDVVINCSGLSSIELFEEKEKQVYLGHTILIPQPVELKKNGHVVSYNYEPAPDLYPPVGGNRQDVYAYSRSGQLLLGGSRIPGQVTDEGFNHPKLPFEMMKTDGKEVPSPIFDLNRQIIQHFFGIDPGEFHPKIGRSAYRYIRNTSDGIRIEAEEKGDKLILHNYGNGGAGVTVSWGAAVRIFNLLAEKMSSAKTDSKAVIRLLGL